MKKLITSGCSFSECITPRIKTWPRHLADQLDYEHQSFAMGSQGNGLISRSVIYGVGEALKSIKAEDILVGIMWSGPDRHDFFHYNPHVDYDDGFIENPTSFIPQHKKRWVIINPSWRNSYARNYYANLHDFVGARIYTLEHILRTQWFLERHHVPYFMTTFTGEVLHADFCTKPDTAHLYDMIDHTKFLPVPGEFEWCRDHSGIEFPIPGDPHPGSEQHRLFTQEVIIPFLTAHGYI